MQRLGFSLRILSVLVVGAAGLNCADPPTDGFFVLQVQRNAEPGLKSLDMAVIAVDAFYESTPASADRHELPYELGAA